MGIIRTLQRMISDAAGPHEPGSEPWSDDPSEILNERAAKNIEARVYPGGRDATEIVLEGICPRCEHRTVSTHAIRSVHSTSVRASLAAADGFAAAASERARRVTAQCCCSHDHGGRPAGERGCGAPFALWVAWLAESSDTDARIEKATLTSLLELEEERDLQASAATQLANVRKAAESWRTGLAGLLAVLTAVFFIKGKSSFDDIEAGWWRRALAALLLAAAASALFGAYRALRAASGTPRDEFVGRASFPFAGIPRLLRSTPGEIDEYGTLSAWRHAFAVQAVKDLFYAKWATVVSLVLVGVAAAVTWFAPGPPPPAFAKVTYDLAGKNASVCGELKRGDGRRFRIKLADGRSIDFNFAQLRSLKIVADCAA